MYPVRYMIFRRVVAEVAAMMNNGNRTSLCQGSIIVVVDEVTSYCRVYVALPYLRVGYPVCFDVITPTRLVSSHSTC